MEEAKQEAVVDEDAAKKLQVEVMNDGVLRRRAHTLHSPPIAVTTILKALSSSLLILLYLTLLMLKSFSFRIAWMRAWSISVCYAHGLLLKRHPSG
ncbi:hypothetical protein GOP47_0000689 [Adiantum capillus-veneris]|uniref:Uncharacterized protein n=1 Tax=Adiantum capillus-veneris TaxID=13818 RepID=A0A9D4ZTB1_ADICA|nr:hypothetical protein GOP47_0000689 [Adiantum capillus-veneris]